MLEQLDTPENSGKIILIVTQMERGGAQTVCVRLANELISRGLDVEVWFLYRKSAAFESLPFVRVVLDRPIKSPLDYFKVYKRLSAMLKENKPQTVITFTHYANVMGLKAAKAAGVPNRIASQHNPCLTYPRPARHADRWLGQGTTYTANIMVSESVYESFQAYPESYRKKCHVIPNGIELRTNAISRDEARSKWSLPADHFLMCSIGRLADQKNQTMLVDMLPELENVSLVIAGEGELKDELEAQAKTLGVENRLILLGSIAQDEVPDLLHACDAFTFPSKFEGLSIALLEALASGITIVASDIPSNREVLVSEQRPDAGFLLSIEDKQPWLDTIRNLQADEQLMETYGQRSKDRSEDFSMQNMADRYLQLCKPQ